MTQKEIALALNVTQPLVSNWYSGKSIPRPETIRKISEVTGKTYHELLNKFHDKNSSREKSKILGLKMKYKESLLSRTLDFLKSNPKAWHTSKGIAIHIRQKYASEYNNKQIICEDITDKDSREKALITQISSEISSHLNRYLQKVNIEESVVELNKISQRRFTYRYKSIELKIEDNPEFSENIKLSEETINDLILKLVENFKSIGESDIIVEKKIDNINFTIEMNII